MTHDDYARKWAKIKARLAADPEYREKYLAKQRTKGRNYYWRDVAKTRRLNAAAARRRRRDNGDAVRAKESAYRKRPEVRERMKKYNKKYRQSHRDYLAEKKKEYSQSQAGMAARSRSEKKRKLRKQSDAVFYHKCLASNRMTHAKARIRAGKSYHPRFNLRFPEWITMGASAIDCTSPFLAVNLTPSQRDFARCLNIERKAARET